MRKKIVLEDDLKDDIYSEFPLSKMTMFFLTILLIIAGFFYNFPFKERLTTAITAQLKKNRSCPISFDQLDFNFINPSISIKKVLVGGRCFQNSQSSLTLDIVRVRLSLPSFSPPGMKLKLEIKKGKSYIKAFPSLSVASSKVEIDKKTRLRLDDFSELLSGKISLKGDLRLVGNVLLKGTKVQNSNFSLTSNNLSIPPQTINNFNLPLIPLKKLSLKAKLNRRGLLNIESFQLGANDAPVFANVKGSMKINQRYVNRSTFDLKGKIKFSQQFYKKDFPILNLLLSGKQKDPQGNFNFTVRGSLMVPNFKIR